MGDIGQKDKDKDKTQKAVKTAQKEKLKQDKQTPAKP